MQVSIVKQAEVKINDAMGEVGKKVKCKWENVMKKNPGFDVMVRIVNIMKGEGGEIPEEMEMSAVTSFKYAPVTSVSVERSFSAFKMILSDKRHSLCVENLEKILVIYCAANYE